MSFSEILKIKKFITKGHKVSEQIIKTVRQLEKEGKTSFLNPGSCGNQ